MRVTDMRRNPGGVILDVVPDTYITEINVSLGVSLITASGYRVWIEPPEWNAMRDEVDRDHANGRL